MSELHHLQANNNAEQQLSSPALRQIVQQITTVLGDADEPYRFRVRSHPGSEVVKVQTMTTDHQLHFSVLTNRQNNVHMKSQRFCTPFDDELRAGWTTPSVCDFSTDRNYRLDPKTLDVIQQTARNWLLLNATNARHPRTTFLARDHRDTAPSRFVAGTFLVAGVSVMAGPGLNIVLSDAARKCRLVLDEKFSRAINDPHGMRGCRAVVHQSGVIRVLRGKTFNQIYELAA